MINPWCAWVQRWMVRLDDRDLDAVRARCLAAHLSRCETCRVAWDSQVTIGSLLRPHRESELADFDRLWDSVAPRLEPHPAVRRRRTLVPSGIWALAGAVSVAIFGWFQFDRRSGYSVSGSNASVVEVVSGPASVSRNAGKTDGNTAAPRAASLSAASSPVRSAPNLQIRTALKSNPQVSVNRERAPSILPRVPTKPQLATTSGEVAIRRTRQVRPLVDPASEPSSSDDRSALKTASWRDDSVSELSPMDAVQQASLSRSLFH